MTSRKTLIQSAAAGLALAALGPAARAQAAAPAPVAGRLTGPVTGGAHGWPFYGFFGDIGALGYVEEEYFLAGEATRYAPVGALGSDGVWQVAPTGTAPFKTRLMVRRPVDPARFNGTVIVDWLNVSGGYDVPVHDTPAVYDAGFAYVGVSAQYVGVHGVMPNPRGLTTWDPARYGGLSHPGDAYSYDIFTQAGRAVGPARPRTGVDPLKGLAVKRLIAAGASQSGGRLVSYANAVQPLAQVYDAIMPTVVGGGGSDFTGEAAGDPARRPPLAERTGDWIPSRIRADLTTPVLILNSESETLQYAPVRQPDSARFRYWEIAGAAHVQYPTRKPLAEKARRDGVAPTGPTANTAAPDPNAMSHVMWMFALDAATAHVDRWIQGGAAPPSQPPIEVAGQPLQIVRDADGIARGGVRLPDVLVPVALNDGSSLFGRHLPFTDAELRRRYPTHADYVAKVTAAVRAAEQAGVLLPRDAKGYLEAARAADVPPAKTG